MTALAGFRVVEIAERVCGEYAAKLLADFGAEVIKVERPSGAPTRSMGPFFDHESLLFRYLNTNKCSVVLDLEKPEDKADLDRLVAEADVLIDDHANPAIAADCLPHLVHCIITPFGQGAPAEWQNAQPLNVLHASGWGYHTPSEANPARPPLKGAGRFLSDYEAGLEAALTIAASLVRKNRTGQGQFIDISEVETLVSRSDCVLGRMLAGEQEPGPERTRFDMGGPGAVFACRDGHVFLLMTTKAHWLGLCALMGDPGWVSGFPEDWLEFHCTVERVAEFRRYFRSWIAQQYKETVSEAAQNLGVALVVLHAAPDLHRNPQYAHRGYFQRLGSALYPTVPYRMSATPVQLASPAPALGADQHNSGTVPKLADGINFGTVPKSGARLRERGGPLAGVRVLELTKVWAGPYAGKLLAFLGAEVIKVESLTNPDEMRAYGGVDLNSAPYFQSINQEILSVQVNMKSDEGIAYLQSMIAQSDVLLDNLRPGAMERAGLSYKDVHKIKPDIIQASIKMYGSDGPLAYQTGYAPCFAALGGLTSLVGYESEPPTGMNIRYGDSTVGTSAAFAIVAALLHRERTGEGQFIDVSAVETMSTMAGDNLFAHGVTGVEPVCDGNAHPEMRFHECLPCADGEWISIAAAGEAEFSALTSILGNSLDTSGHDAGTLAAELRTNGVPAFRSQSSLDLVSDPYLWERGCFREVSDQRHGTRPVIGPGWRMTPDEALVECGAPKLGEHNDFVYKDLLGLSDGELEDIIQRKVAY